MTAGRPSGGGAVLLRLYPRGWRLRYEAEVTAVLDQNGLTLRDRLDLLRGAVDAHLHPATPSGLPVFSALAGGALWMVAGVAVLAQPVPPDWPGYLIEMLPIALAGTLLITIAIVGAWLRVGDAMPGASHVALAAAVAGHLLWAAALLAGILAIDYGASTAIAQTAAAVGTLLVGLVLGRSGEWRVASFLLLASLALVIPHPASFVAFGLAWTTIGLLRAREIQMMRTACEASPG